MSYSYILPIIFLGIILQGCGGGGGGGGSPSSSSSSSSSTHSTYGYDLPPVIDRQNRALLVVRIEYNDTRFVNSSDIWNRKIFGYKNHQLNHYFSTLSNGLFTLNIAQETDGLKDGIIEITLPSQHPNSTSNGSIHKDLIQALKIADQYIDFSAYDTNEDQKLSANELLFLFVVAGGEKAFYPTTTPSVWAHQHCLSSKDAPKLDAIKVLECDDGKYALIGERHIERSYSKDATIGIIAHELSHAAFNLPDLYSTVSSATSAGIGYFGLMSSGFWGRSSLSDPYGNTPVMMSAYSRVKSGLIKPHIKSESRQADLLLHDTSQTDFNIALLPIDQNEYFLIENRSILGYDAGLFDLQGGYSGGLAIWHIDQKIIQSQQASNSVNNNPAHKGVDLEEADIRRLDLDSTFKGSGKNLYYRGNIDTFSPQSTPSSDRYSGAPSGIYVDNISSYSQTMRLRVTNPNKVPQ